MSGDKIHTTVQYYYTTNAKTGSASSLNTLVAGLVNSLVNSVGSPAAIKASPTTVTNPLLVQAYKSYWRKRPLVPAIKRANKLSFGLKKNVCKYSIFHHEPQIQILG